MTEPNIEQILSELPDEVRYKTILTIMAKASNSFTSKTVREAADNIPINMLIETLDALVSGNDDHLLSAAQFIGRFEGTRRKCNRLMEKGAEIYLEDALHHEWESELKIYNQTQEEIDRFHHLAAGLSRLSFGNAGELFEECGRFKDAVTCYVKAEHWASAGNVSELLC